MASGGGKESQHKMSDDEIQDTSERKTDPCYEHLKVQNDQLKKEIQHLKEEKDRNKADHRKATTEQDLKINELTMQVASLSNQFEKKKKELRETFLELKRVSIQARRLTDEKKNDTTLHKSFKSRNNATIPTQTLQPSTSLQPTMFPSQTGAGTCPIMKPNSQSHDIHGDSENYSADVSNQERLEVLSSTGGESLNNILMSDIEQNLPNYNKLLLYTISDQLKTWASTAFGREYSVEINKVLRDLDQKKMIDPPALKELRELFERIGRFDLVYLVDHFLCGNYRPLHNMSSAASSQRTFNVPCTQSPTSLTNELQPPEKNLSVRPQGDTTEDSQQGETSFMAGDKMENPRQNSSPDVQVATARPNSLRNNDDDDDEKAMMTNTKFVERVRCGTEQQFSATSQFCRKCRMKFTNYFCVICKHLSGTDDTPYRCEKCGICRINQHRAFHCDTCGVCLDVPHQHNHNCRKGSDHEKCCFCLQDAFTGCRVLPCSHKVHKECEAQMIRSGITWCPVCYILHMQESQPE